jgi:sugar phosphate isomerase/epimerase
LIHKIKTVNLKADRPTVQAALDRLDRELLLARERGCGLLKVIHGYGSTGAGGDIRIAVQKRLRELVSAGEIGGCIFGENWSKADDETWRILQTRTELKEDPDLGRRNLGITIVIL